MKISLVIPAKGTSQRVTNKNLYEINGISLVERACHKALQCKTISKVYLDTEDDGIILNCSKLIPEGLEIIKRPKELATNYIGANELLIYAIHSIEHCDLILQTFSTSPLISPATIDKCVETFLSSDKNNDSFFTVVKLQEYFWKNNRPMNFATDTLPNSFELEPIFLETHGLYGIYTNTLLEHKQRVGKNPLLIEIPKIESFDVNDYEDLEIVERLITGVKQNENQ